LSDKAAPLRNHSYAKPPQRCTATQSPLRKTTATLHRYAKLHRYATKKQCGRYQRSDAVTSVGASSFFLRFRFGDRKEILRDRLEKLERPFSIDVISGQYILRDRWTNLRGHFGPSKHLKNSTGRKYMEDSR